MSAPKDGGPAFPLAFVGNPPYGPQTTLIAGMPLRDWFAGQALTGLLASGQWNNNGLDDGFAEHIARHASNIADAMLAERAK